MASSADVLTTPLLAAGLGSGNPALWVVIIAAAVLVVVLAVRSDRR
jgi:hypothetical protein